MTSRAGRLTLLVAASGLALGLGGTVAEASPVAHAAYLPLLQNAAGQNEAGPNASASDQEIWAGISLGDAVAGAALLGGGAVVIAVITGSTTLAIAAAAATAFAFVAYDPGTPSLVSPSDLPTLFPDAQHSDGK
jgi:hypothetical protein